MEGDGKTGGQTDSSPPQHSVLYLHDAFMVADWGVKADIQQRTMLCVWMVAHLCFCVQLCNLHSHACVCVCTRSCVCPRP